MKNRKFSAFLLVVVATYCFLSLLILRGGIALIVLAGHVQLKGKKTQPIMAVVAKIGAASSAFPPITAKEHSAEKRACAHCIGLNGAC
jgi:hypothetical protein